MARIRSIKPDFWTDGNIVTLSLSARLLYIGMWNFALCDHGHVSDDMMKLKLQILPMDQIDVSGLVQELIDTGRIERVQDRSNRTYLSIRRFTDHQKIDPRWRSRCPACAERDSLELIETRMSLVELNETHDNSGQLPLGKDRKGKDSKKTCPATQDEFDQWYSGYPKKEAKEAARRAFVKARRSTSLDELIAGRDRYVVSMQGKDRQYIALPATWLNAGRWADEPQDPLLEDSDVPHYWRAARGE